MPKLKSVSVKKIQDKISFTVFGTKEEVNKWKLLAAAEGIKITELAVKLFTVYGENPQVKKKLKEYVQKTMQ